MSFRSKLKSLFRKQTLDAEMAEEMRGHLERRTPANLAAGMSPDEARYAAQRQFGGEDQLKEIAREQRGWVWLEPLLQDLRFAAGGVRKNPGFTFDLTGGRAVYLAGRAPSGGSAAPGHVTFAVDRGYSGVTSSNHFCLTPLP